MDEATHIPGEVLVVGTGLVGTSIGLRLIQMGVMVWLWDVDSAALAAAVELDAGQELGPEADPDLVVIAVPPGQVVSAALTALDRYPRAIVCDVAGSKAGIVSTVAAAAGANGSRFLGSHPIAGREVSGPRAARADMFEHQRWALTPTPATPHYTVAAVRALAEGCGAVVVSIDPGDHDRAVALTSHVPQVVASTLAARLADADQSDLSLSGQGLRDATRIADSDPAMWADLLTSNAREIAPVLEELISDLRTVADELGGEPGPSGVSVRRVLERGNIGRARLPAKHGGAAARYSTVTVLIADQPGQLALLFTTAGDAEVNLEDVRIEHTVGRKNALIELSVLPGARDSLVEALVRGGWHVRQ